MITVLQEATESLLDDCVWITDFEVAMLQALRAEISRRRFGGCLFHFAETIVR